MSNQKAVLGLVGGLAAGAILGLLFAPRSGKKTREALMRRGKQAQKDMHELIEEGHRQWSKVRNKAADAASMTRDEVEDFVRYLFDEGGMMKEGRESKREAHNGSRKTAATH